MIVGREGGSTVVSMSQKQSKSGHQYTGAISPSFRPSDAYGILETTKPDDLISVWPRTSLTLAICIFLFGIFTAATTAVIVYRTFSPIIQWDQWIVVNELMQHDSH